MKSHFYTCLVDFFVLMKVVSNFFFRKSFKICSRSILIFRGLTFHF